MLSKPKAFLVSFTLFVISTPTLWTPVHSFTAIASNTVENKYRISSYRSSSVSKTRPTQRQNNRNRNRKNVLHDHSSASGQSQSSSPLSTSSGRAAAEKRRFEYTTSLRFLMKALPFVGILTLIKALSGTISIAPLLAALNTLFVQFPYIAAFTVCGVKASLADFVAQTSISAGGTTYCWWSKKRQR